MRDVIRRQLSWSFAAHAVGISLPPLLLIALARLLEPADFGIFALIMLTITAVQAIAIGPIGEVIVQSAREDIGNFVFSVQMVIGSVWAVIIFASAGLLADVFREPYLQDALRVSSLLLVITPVSDTAIRMSMREFAFRVVFVRRLVTPLVNGCASIPLAVMGAGHWALVVGQLLGFVVVGAIVLFIGSWKPRCTLDLLRFRADIAFGWHMVIQGMVKWVRNQSDRAILAVHISSNDLGQYDIARRLTGIPIAAIVDPVAQVLYATMSDRARNGEEIRDIFLISQRRILMIAIPVALVMALHSSTIVELALGPKWLGITSAFTLLALAGGVSAFVSFNLEVFKSKGQLAIMTRFMIVRALVTLGAYLFLAPNGVIALAWAVLGLACVFSPINVYITMRFLGVSLREYILTVAARPLLVSASVIMVSYLTRVLAAGNIPVDVIQILGSAIVVILSILIWERDMFYARNA